MLWALIVVTVNGGQVNRRSRAPGQLHSRLLQSLLEPRRTHFSFAGSTVSGPGAKLSELSKGTQYSGSLSVQSYGSLLWVPCCWPAAVLEEGPFLDPNRPKHSFSMQDRGL